MTEKKPLAVRSALVERPARHQPVPLGVSPPHPELEEFDTRSPLRRLVIAGLATVIVSFGGFFAYRGSAASFPLLFSGR